MAVLCGTSSGDSWLPMHKAAAASADCAAQHGVGTHHGHASSVTLHSADKGPALLCSPASGSGSHWCTRNGGRPLRRQYRRELSARRGPSCWRVARSRPPLLASSTSLLPLTLQLKSSQTSEMAAHRV